MPPCTGACPQVYIGYDSSSGLYTYSALDCQPGQGGLPTLVITSTTRMHTTGGDCSNCTDCITDPMGSGDGPDIDAARVIVPGTRRVFRKGVPNPINSGAGLDEFIPGPGIIIVGDFTAEYSRGRDYLVRLVSVASATQPQMYVGLGWELDPQSPPSPSFIPHLNNAWITPGADERGGHVIQVANLGAFHIRTAR